MAGIIDEERDSLTGVTETTREHVLVSIPNGEHGLGGGDRKLIDKAYQSAFEFVNKYMKASR